MIISKNLIKTSSHIKSALNTLNSIQLFSSDTLNYRIPLQDPFTSKPTDQFIYRYSNHMFSAYMDKRKLKRSQIWPKIHILEDPPLNQQAHVKCQKLFQVKRLLDQNLMKRIVREDPTQINSTFIISLFSQQNFKQLMDQYVKKTLVCGKAPSQQSEQKMRELQAKVMNLYRNFYFGETITPLQRQIELYYLAEKQQKSRRRKLVPKNQYFRCTWREQDQRLIQDVINWPEADINLSDLSYRPYYQRLNIQSRFPYVQKYTRLIGGSNFLTRWQLNNSIKKQYTYSQKYLTWIKQKTFTRIIQYSKCLEFTQNMRIPPDFMIEMSIINIHIWLITDRLRQINTKKTTNLARMLDRMFYQYFDNLIGSLNVKKLSITRRKLQQILAVNRNNLNMHFNGYDKTKKNPYLFIDALVWSVAFRGKTQRYADEVYKFSQYLIKNWQHLKNFEEQDFMDAICELDCFLIDPDYKQKIIQINPPMPKEQFEQEFKSNKMDKKYYYRTNTENLDYTIQLKQPKDQQQKFSFTLSLLQKIGHFVRKYLSNMEKFDHFSAMDQQKKETQIKDRKSPWKSQTDRLTQVDSEMSSIKQIRRERSRRKQSSNIQSAEDAKKPETKSQQKKKE